MYDGVIFLITLEYCREAGFDIAGPIGFRALVRPNLDVMPLSLGAILINISAFAHLLIMSAILYAAAPVLFERLQGRPGGRHPLVSP